VKEFHVQRSEPFCLKCSAVALRVLLETQTREQRRHTMLRMLVARTDATIASLFLTSSVLFLVFQTRLVEQEEIW